ncbi:hypothetical protein MAR_035691 [Mya arenaria]|uniref:Uncharacterized protein n=1 Tax=Mya arenaria TaxID=6604 RepID=A0ABY7EN37_MYAAR|nr:hypothetical protein MAR_035691 [Mya arenaria]
MASQPIQCEMCLEENAVGSCDTCGHVDLEEVCDQHEEVTGSDDENSDDDATSTTELNKTRRDLTALLNQAKHNLEQSEKTRRELTTLLNQIKQDLDKSEKDLEEVCELHEEVTGSDDGNSDDYATSTTEINKGLNQLEVLKSISAMKEDGLSSTWFLDSRMAFRR